MKKFLLLVISILMLSTTIFATESYDTMLISSFDDLYDTTLGKCEIKTGNCKTYRSEGGCYECGEGDNIIDK